MGDLQARSPSWTGTPGCNHIEVGSPGVTLKAHVVGRGLPISTMRGESRCHLPTHHRGDTAAPSQGSLGLAQGRLGDAAAPKTRISPSAPARDSMFLSDMHFTI